eukprot:gene11200-13058_t
MFSTARTLTRFMSTRQPLSWSVSARAYSTTYYTKSHEWIRVDGEVGEVGITDYAQRELGDIVFVDLPNAGQKYNATDAVIVLESTKAASDVYTPVSGTIVDTNEELRGDPALVNSGPMTEGWLFKIKLSNPAELKGLLTSDPEL